jgi:hypothetical protein
MNRQPAVWASIRVTVLDEYRQALAGNVPHGFLIHPTDRIRCSECSRLFSATSLEDHSFAMYVCLVIASCHEVHTFPSSGIRMSTRARQLFCIPTRLYDVCYALNRRRCSVREEWETISKTSVPFFRHSYISTHDWIYAQTRKQCWLIIASLRFLFLVLWFFWMSPLESSSIPSPVPLASFQDTIHFGFHPLDMYRLQPKHLNVAYHSYSPQKILFY